MYAVSILKSISGKTYPKYVKEIVQVESKDEALNIGQELLSNFTESERISRYFVRVAHLKNSTDVVDLKPKHSWDLWEQK